MKILENLAPPLLFAVLAVPFSSQAAEEEDLTFGVGANYNYNIQSDYYDDAAGLYGIAGYGKFQAHVGVKRFVDNQKGAEKYISDLSLFYKLYEDEDWRLNLGLGLEKTSPTIDYLVQYKLAPSVNLNAGLSQVLSEDYIDNYTEVLLGLSYSFGANSTESTLDGEVIEVRPSDAEDDLNDSGFSKDSQQEKPDQNGTKLANPYVVVEGDWLIKINKKYKANLKEVVAENNISDPDLIYPKQEIYFYFD
ncbi:LysM peptidoglycan-binding domain-containing protein [Vibrio jasicida]|uniref:LysM peptidoglycan-binding domain-containing protein n=1 Tax=Vibrio jasicida TaxID=766224 RepID=UPI0040689832